MRINNKILLLFITVINLNTFSFGQLISFNGSDLYINKLEKGDTLQISIEFYINRGTEMENISIYKNETGSFFALIKCNNMKAETIELTSSELNALKLFEEKIRNQCLKSNIPIYIHSLAKYEIKYKGRLIAYSTKNEFYSLCEEFKK